MLENPWLYFPTALMLGALHALEPGHAKTLTAAYLIGIRGTKRHALLLGLSVAATHSFVVVTLSALALWLGRETLTSDVTRWLQLGSGLTVILLGSWMLARRLRQLRRTRFTPISSGERLMAVRAPAAAHHDHDHLSDDEHARAHAATIPDYAKRGERPGVLQIVAFGAAGGMIPCPASVTVMLLALSVGRVATGLLTVAGFSLGLAATLVGTGLLVVAGICRLEHTGHFHRLSRHAPVLSAGVVILSGMAALALAR